MPIVASLPILDTTVSLTLPSGYRRQRQSDPLARAKTTMRDASQQANLSLHAWERGDFRVWREQLLLQSRQAPISMGFGARLPGTKLTFFSRLSATSGAAHRQCLFLGDSDGNIMGGCSAERCSVLNQSPPKAIQSGAAVVSILCARSDDSELSFTWNEFTAPCKPRRGYASSRFSSFSACDIGTFFSPSRAEV